MITTPPSTPDFGSTLNTSIAVNVYADAVSDNEPIAYELEYSTDPSGVSPPFTAIGFSVSGTIDVTGLTPGTTYYFRVKAVDADPDTVYNAGGTGSAATTNDFEAPVFSSAAVNAAGTLLVVTMNDELGGAGWGPGDLGDWTVAVDESPATITAAGLNGADVEIALPDVAFAGQVVTVQYANSGNRMGDLQSNWVASFGPESVTNNSIVPPPPPGGGGGGGGGGETTAPTVAIGAAFGGGFGL